MQTQVLPREQIKRNVVMHTNKAEALILFHKREGEKQVRHVGPLNMKLSDLRKMVEIIEGEIEFIQKTMRDRIQHAENGYQLLRRQR